MYREDLAWPIAYSDNYTVGGSGKPQPLVDHVLDFYEVESPVKGIRLYVTIGERNGELVYAPVEPPLNRMELLALLKLKKFMHDYYIPRNPDLVFKEPHAIILEVLREGLRRFKLQRRLSRLSIQKIAYYLYRDHIGYGPLEVMMRDPQVEDISVPGVGYNVYVWHTKYENIKTTVKISSGEVMRDLINRFAVRGRVQLSATRPIADAITPEGYRAHLVLGNVASSGGTITVRKFRATPFTILELVANGTIDLNLAAYLWYLVENKRSIVIFGPTGAGKTTLLNALAMLILPSMKIITIEETRELNLLHPHWVPLVAPPGSGVKLYDLVASSLRQRPDYIIVGEIRGEEAYVFFQAVATGHGGLTTMHAESINAAIARLTSPPMNVSIEHIGSIDAFVYINRVRVRGRIVRRVLEVSEVVEVDSYRRKVTFNTAFRWTGELTDTFSRNTSIVLQRIAEHRVVDPSIIEREVEERKRILEDLLRRGAISYEEFAREITSYYLSRLPP